MQLRMMVTWGSLPPRVFLFRFCGVLFPLVFHLFMYFFFPCCVRFLVAVCDAHNPNNPASERRCSNSNVIVGNWTEIFASAMVSFSLAFSSSGSVVRLCQKVPGVRPGGCVSELGPAFS